MSELIEFRGGVEVFDRRPARFIRENFDDLEPGVSLEVVKGLWPRSGLAFVGGPSMSGKTFWTLDALARICRGEDVLGRRSVQSGVLYIAAEAPAGVRKRIKALREKGGPLDGAFQFIGQAPNLCDADDLAQLREAITDAQAEMLTNGFRLGVVAVDTLSAVIPGADENSAASMSPVLHALQSLAAELEVLVLVLAHPGKDAERGLRGWSGLLANADSVLMLETPDGETRTGVVTKVKDGLAGDRFAFYLERVVLGLDDDGDEISTCVIQETDAPEARRPGRRASKAGGTGDLILRAFDRVLEARPHPIAGPGIPAGHSGVDVGELRAMTYQIGLGGPRPEVPPDTSDRERKAQERKWNDHRGKDFKRGLEYLLEDKTLRQEGELICLVKSMPRPAL
ncbi:MAG: AAA family ATPase [Phenylobacterium sp.]|uniref:AAA family ATPase n=1 Tax=Phenylobacterium sp. TaxID=1871053 RepID=UPI0025CF68AF|nr:AAA family ATPase [Phenylobacterium sp.]MCA3758263.1 AAA family ATPase [Phenylobacterium sp.]MCA6237824.1 AAA family ATPase [Phenylobacterium sp.]MCA6253686.1 AAA family ATPase [Phenylobacterium sp.]MCA6272002.1 AAA family ATPase [Phenylobacterium sp.]